jgi:integrase
MGRRKKNSLPELRYHKGQARLRLAGTEYYCGRFGSPESFAERDRLLGDFLRAGRKHAPDRSPRSGRRSAQPPQPLVSSLPPEQQPLVAAAPAPRSPSSHNGVERKAPAAAPTTVTPAVGEITVGDLALRWLDDIERNHCKRGKHRTSLFYTARQAINALEDYWGLPVSQFGTRALMHVQEKLAATPCKSRPKDPSKKPRSWPRTRQGVNNIVDRIRAMFRFGVLLEVVSAEHANCLKMVPGLTKQQVDNLKVAGAGRVSLVEGNRKRPVSDALVNATLHHLPPVIADLLRLQRFTGCRPGEARTLRPCDIDRRPLPEYRGAWLWAPPEWKLSHLEGIPPREIWIGPDAQKVLTPWLDSLSETPTCFVFSPRRREHPLSASRGAKNRRRGRRSRPRVANDCYSKDALNRAIKRACGRAALQAWTAGQLRHTRLTEVRAQQGLDAAQAIGGHTSITQTQHYTELQRGTALDATLGVRAAVSPPGAVA